MNDAVLERFNRNVQARAEAERKRAASGFGSLVLGLLLVAGLAAGYVLWREGPEGFRCLLSSEEGGGVVARIREALFGPPVQYNPYMDEYARVALSFGEGKLALWKEMPRDMKPKNASAGTVYHALVPHGNGFDLYALKAGGVVEQLSPFGKPVSLTFAEFKTISRRQPYYIACFGRVFLCGSSDLKGCDERRKVVRHK